MTCAKTNILRKMSLKYRFENLEKSIKKFHKNSLYK